MCALIGGLRVPIDDSVKGKIVSGMRACERT